MLGQVLISHSFHRHRCQAIHAWCLVLERLSTRVEYDLLFVLQSRSHKLDLAPFPIGGVLNGNVLRQF